MGRTRTAVIAAAVLALLAAGCSWGQYGHDGSHAGFSPAENVLTTGNVGSLAPLWETDSNVGFGTQIAYGSVFSLNAFNSPRRLLAYAADGSEGCSGTPRRCEPRWTAPLSMSLNPTEARTGAYAVDRDRVYVVGFMPEPGPWRLEVFDAHGEQGCGGTPRTCAPLWHADWGAADVTGGATLAVANDKVYVTTPFGPSAVTVFDAAGVSNCSGGAHPTCEPLFSTATPSGNPIAVDSTRLTVGVDGGGFKVFDAQGVTGCANEVCSPVRTITGLHNPSLSGDVAYTNFGVADLASTAGCSGSPPSCPPTWTTTLTTGALAVPPVVAAGRMLVPQVAGTTMPGRVLAFDAEGLEGCSGAPRVCTSVLQYVTQGSVHGVSATGTLVFVSSAVTSAQGGTASSSLMAFDRAGIEQCSGSPTSCEPLWTVSYDPGLVGILLAPTVANGVVAVGGTRGTIKVFAIPQ